MCRFNNCLQLAVHLSVKYNPTASIHSPKETAQINQTPSLSENDCGGHELNFLTFQRKKKKLFALILPLEINLFQNHLETIINKHSELLLYKNTAHEQR